MGRSAGGGGAGAAATAVVTAVSNGSVTQWALVGVLALALVRRNLLPIVSIVALAVAVACLGKTLFNRSLNRCKAPSRKLSSLLVSFLAGSSS